MNWRRPLWPTRRSSVARHGVRSHPVPVARTRVLHSGCVEGRAPALLVVAGQLQVVALAGHADCDMADPGPRVKQGPERMERAIVRGHWSTPAKPTAARRSWPRTHLRALRVMGFPR